MNQCKQCSKEIPEGKKFCNSSCAARYNNVHRTRKPWTEEQKQRIRKPRKAAVKHQSVDKQKKLYDRCIKALNLPAESSKEIVENTIRKLYWEDKISIVDFWVKYKIPYWILLRIFKNIEISFRTPKEGLHQACLNGKIKISLEDPKYSHGHHKTWEGKNIYYRSSYELEYALYLDEQQISYNVEDLRIEYFDTQRNEMRVAIPDFYLPETNEIVEIKSTWTYDKQLMKDKFKAYKALGYIPRLILDKKEIKLVY